MVRFLHSGEVARVAVLTATAIIGLAGGAWGQADVGSAVAVVKRVAVAYGQSEIVKFNSEVHVVHSADEAVCTGEKLGANGTRGADSVVLTGRCIGTTTVTIAVEGNTNPVVYAVDVIRDSARLAVVQQAIRTQFSAANVEIVPIDGSTKILVRGCVCDQKTACDIISCIHDKNVPPSEVINQLRVYCYPVPCQHVKGGRWR